MNEKAYKTLEYGKIINKLTEFAGSSLGAERCKNTFPLTDIKEIKRLQRETSDAYVRLMKKGSVSFSGIPDIRASVKRLEVEATLGAGELLKISALLTAALRVKIRKPSSCLETGDGTTGREEGSRTCEGRSSRESWRINE